MGRQLADWLMPHGSHSQEPPLKTTGIDGDLGAEAVPRAWRPIVAPMTGDGHFSRRYSRHLCKP